MAIEISAQALVKLHQAWDKFDAAARRIQITQAADLTEASRKLEEARAEMSSAIKATYS